MKFVTAMLAGILLLVAVAALPSAPQQVPSPKDVVAPTIYASLDPVGRGSAFQIAAVLKIRPGFHINAREKSEDYLIATDLRADAPAGFQLGEVSYPKGALHSFTFSKKPLNVYEDTIRLYLPVTALPNAPLGAQHIPSNCAIKPAARKSACLLSLLRSTPRSTSPPLPANPAIPKSFLRNSFSRHHYHIDVRPATLRRQLF